MTERIASEPFAVLEEVRVQRDWPYRELAAFLGMKIPTIASAIRRGRANKRTTYRVQEFLRRTLSREAA